MKKSGSVLKLEDFRKLFKSIDLSVTVMDAQGMFIEYNDAFLQMMDYTDETPGEVFHPGMVSGIPA